MSKVWFFYSCRMPPKESNETVDFKKVADSKHDMQSPDEIFVFKEKH